MVKKRKKNKRRNARLKHCGESSMIRLSTAEVFIR